MKNKKVKCLYLLPLLGGMLSSCTLLIYTDAPFVAKQAVTYDLRYLEDSNRTEIKTAFNTTYYTLATEDYLIPYYSLEGYAELVAHYFDARAFSKFSYNGKNPIWQVYLNSDKPNTNPSYLFFAILDVNQNAFYVGGSLYNAITKNIIDSKGSSLGIGLRSSYVTYEEGKSYSVYSFADLVHGKKWYGGDVYLPLGVFDAALGQTCEIYHLVDMNRFFAYTDPGETYLERLYYQDEHIIPGLKSYSYYSENGMPLTLREYEKDVFYFVFESRYGLKAYKKITSMSEYFNNKGIGDLLLSSSAEERQKGFFDAINSFQDLHTSAWALTSWWGDTKEGVTRSEASLRRSNAMNKLGPMRTSAFGESLRNIQYHEDMAFFTLNGFEATFSAYEDDNVTIVDNIDELDSYFYAIKQLNEIKAHGGIKDVVIDISTNGGGYVTIMSKIVTLLSKDNQAYFASYDSEKGSLSNSYVHVDSNLDGIYDENDVYGNEFNFHILTSLCSYSAGNAMPFYARKLGFADIIGENSGGGECTVESVCLPSGRGFRFSTSNHIGFVEKEGDAFVGDEPGAGIDIELSYDKFYDLQALYSAINTK